MFVTMNSKRTKILEDIAEEYNIPPDDLERAYEEMLEANFHEDIKELAKELSNEQ